MLELVEPTVLLRDAWLEAHDEWGPGLHEDGFGLASSDDVATAGGFQRWVERLNAESSSDEGADPPQTRSICRWVVEDGSVLGGIALRLGDNELTRRLGHVGFGIRPSARRRGVATWALGSILDVARSLGMEQVLLVCDPDNVASAKTIESLGGILESAGRLGPDPVACYWIDP